MIVFDFQIGIRRFEGKESESNEINSILKSVHRARIYNIYVQYTQYTPRSAFTHQLSVQCVYVVSV